jgi:hypothetical protein
LLFDSWTVVKINNKFKKIYWHWDGRQRPLLRSLFGFSKSLELVCHALSLNGRGPEPFLSESFDWLRTGAGGEGDQNRLFACPFT